MPALLHDNPDARQLALDGGDPGASRPAAQPTAWRKDCSGMDWSCTRARPSRLNNRWPAAPGGAGWYDLRVWNSGYWAGVLISPRHVLVCHHYYQAVPSQRNELLFLGEHAGQVVEHRPAVVEVMPSVAQDLTVLLLDRDAPPGILVLDRIADMTTAPPGTLVWCQSPQSWSWAAYATPTLQWGDVDMRWDAKTLTLAGHPDFPGFGGPLPEIWSGDSGTPAMVRGPDGRQAFAGLLWSHAPIRFGRGPAEPVSPFQVLRNILNEAGHDLVAVDLGHAPPPPPLRSPDIDRDGLVDARDLAIVQAAWGTSSALADLNRDGVVDAADMAMVLGAWKPAGATGGGSP